MADWHSIRNGAPAILEKADKAAQELDTEYNYASFVISDGSVDRHNDIVSPDGMDKSHYNGVVLFNHQHEMLPVGKAVKVWQHSGQIKAVQQFIPRDIYAFAGLVYDMYKGGYMTDTSIGMNVIEAEVNEERSKAAGILAFDLKQWELIEFSNVTIGANRNARVLDVKAFHMAAEAGIDVEEAAKWADEVLQKDLVSDNKLRLQYIDMYQSFKKSGQYFLVDQPIFSPDPAIKNSGEVSKPPSGVETPELFTESELSMLEMQLRKDFLDD